jgi:CRP/FNR family cyclic AMP-dependent transcriptional regulator
VGYRQLRWTRSRVRGDLGKVSILEAEPDLAQGIDASQVGEAGHAAWARTGVLWPGDRPVEAASSAGSLGVLVLTGLLTRRIQLGERRSIELLGGGDLVRPSQTDGKDYATVPINAHWRVIEPTWIAILDQGFPRRVAQWPAITGNLVDRAAQRADSLAVRLAVAQIPQLTSRLRLILWHLADRWGRVESGGVSLPLRLSHSTLAELVCAQRPSVSHALRELESRKVLSRLPRGGWQLHGGPPDDLIGSLQSVAADERLAQNQ